MHTKMKKKIVKRNGYEELFDPQKLCGSIEMTGAPENISREVCFIVSQSIEDHMSTDRIFKITRDYLYRYDPDIAALYGLERGLSALGPSGFVFEQFIAALFLDIGGYQVKTNVYLEGEAVSHELDVWAEKGNVVFLVEAKYRNDFKTKTHINQIMYADARLQDIRRKAQKEGDTREYYMWLITNTQFTDNAIQYVQYRDMQIVGWNFPKYINIMKIVYEKKLYPVTILPSITKSALKSMAHMNTILVKDLKPMSLDELKETFQLSMTLAKKLYQEIQDLTNDHTV